MIETIRESPPHLETWINNLADRQDTTSWPSFSSLG